MTLGDELCLDESRRDLEIDEILDQLSQDLLLKWQIKELMEQNFSDPFHFYRKPNLTCEGKAKKIFSIIFFQFFFGNF